MTAKKKIEPLPCPWCDKKPKVVHVLQRYSEQPDAWRVECQNPHCRVQPGVAEWDATREAAVGIWNRRRP